ncbi:MULTISPECIES: metallophosphoesterase [unclassified Streptomyces]|uniref:metallophosphoesterase n=1 Tax=unclassified Streptomyces TaxID=2593676 RepID=UPI002DD7E2A0|nr:metallophosphoesterase [Streptomyces sp. NBC_01445]WSE02317.1 metallophosphoesterase [Streptomyces sp. NBC_01445]
MCDDEYIPPRPDLTESQWLDLDTTITTTGRPAPTAGGPSGLVGRRTVLGGAVAGAAALAVLPQAAAASPRSATAADVPVAKFPFPTRPGRGGQYAVLLTGDAGTGDDAQYAVATAAKAICRTEGVSLAVGLGDNLYENGPESAHDDEFATKFEQPNDGIDVPWLMVLGNHDCSGLIPGSGGDPSRGDREVAYATTSRRWHMPARYYSTALPSAADPDVPLVEFFAIDTNPIASTVIQLDPYFQWNGPYMREQRRWLDSALSASRATWKIVIGHHPYLNNGKHGSAGSYDGFVIGNYTSGIHLKELYEEVVCGRADLILSGHDHTQQILEPTSRSRGTRQIVCGTAGKSGDGKAHGTHPARWQDFSHNGFMVLKASAKSLTIDAYTVDAATSTSSLAHSFTTMSALTAAR